MRSENFVTNVNHSTNAGARVLADLRAKVSASNRAARLSGSPVRLRVVLSYRKGRENKHAWKYENKHSRRWRSEDMSSVDVYVVQTKR